MTLDKCERAVAEDARARRLAELSLLTPPSAGTFQIDGQTITVHQAWADVEFRRYVRREREQLQTWPLERLVLTNANVHGAVMWWRRSRHRTARAE